MSISSAKQPTVYKWKPGDLITASEACALLGYKSPKQLQDASRRAAIAREFAALGCKLTCDIRIGGGSRFLRSEIEEFITRTVEDAQRLALRQSKKSY